MAKFKVCLSAPTFQVRGCEENPLVVASLQFGLLGTDCGGYDERSGDVKVLSACGASLHRRAKGGRCGALWWQLLSKTRHRRNSSQVLPFRGGIPLCPTHKPPSQTPCYPCAPLEQPPPPPAATHPPKFHPTTPTASQDDDDAATTTAATTTAATTTAAGLLRKSQHKAKKEGRKGACDLEGTRRGQRALPMAVMGDG
jgi:hypothetical protein